MKSSTSDKVNGTLHQAQGAVKEVAGKITNNPNLEGEGKGEKLSGKVQKKIGEVEQVLGE